MRVITAFKDAGIAFYRGVTASDDDRNFRNVFDSQTYTGKDVTEQSALKMSAVFACVRVLSETLASLPFFLYRRLPGGGKERAVEHPLYGFLHDKPNEEMSSMVFRETFIAHLCTWGNAYIEAEKTRLGVPLWMYPLPPNRMKVERINKLLVYSYRKDNGQYKVFPPGRILHIPALGYDGVVGYSPIAKAREAIGLGLGAEEFGARLFGNYGRPPLVIRHPGKLKQPIYDRLKEQFNKQSGLAHAHETMIIEEGMEIEKIGIPPEDAQFLQTRKFSIAEIARYYRMPLHKIQEMDKATFSNIEHQSIEFVTDTLLPWAVRIEQSFQNFYLREDERREYFIKHLLDGLLRGDIKTRYEAYKTGRLNGWLTADDIMEMEDRNPLPDGLGKIYWAPLNMVPMDQWKAISGSVLDDGQQTDEEGNEDEPPDDKDGEEENSLRERAMRQERAVAGRVRIKQAHEGLLRDAAERVVNRETIAVKRAVKKFLTPRQSAGLLDFGHWIDEFYKTMPGHIVRNFMAAYMAFADSIQNEVSQEIGREAEMDEELQQFVRDYADGYGDRHTKSSVNQIKQLMLGEEIAENIIKRMDGWEKTRADQIATQEGNRLLNATVLKTFAIGGIMSYIWKTAGRKNCPYCDSLEGKRVSMGGQFIQPNTDFKPGGVDKPMKVRGLTKHPPLHKGCDCTIVAG